MQPGFFDHQGRLDQLERLGDPLPKLERSVDWETFRSELEKVYKRSDPRKGGRPPFDAVLMFKVLVLQDFYKLSDDQTEFQIRDRYSFCRFLGLSPEGGVPDAKTIWLFRERVKQAKLIEKLFDAVLVQIEMAGLTARKGQIVDAALVPVPKQRNSRDENARIKAGEFRPSVWPDRSRHRPIHHRADSKQRRVPGHQECSLQACDFLRCFRYRKVTTPSAIAPSRVKVWYG
jgi:transposase